MITVLAKQPGKSHFLGWRLQLHVLAGKARCLPLHSIFFQFGAGPLQCGRAENLQAQHLQNVKPPASLSSVRNIPASVQSLPSIWAHWVCKLTSLTGFRLLLFWDVFKKLQFAFKVNHVKILCLFFWWNFLNLSSLTIENWKQWV